MLAIYRRSGNAPPAENLTTTLTTSAVPRLARQARQLRLAGAAAVRRAGYAPWLIAMGALAMAALQEPTLLRSYGIRLPWQAAWAVGGTLLAVLATGLPPTRHEATQVASLNALTMFVASALGGAVATCDLLLGRADVLTTAAAWAAGFALSLNHFAITVAAWRGEPTAVTNVAVVVAGLLAVVLAVRFDAGNWSPSVLAATLLANLAAIAFVRTLVFSHHAHRHPR